MKNLSHLERRSDPALRGLGILLASVANFYVAAPVHTAPASSGSASPGSNVAAISGSGAAPVNGGAGSGQAGANPVLSAHVGGQTYVGSANGARSGQTSGTSMGGGGSPGLQRSVPSVSSANRSPHVSSSVGPRAPIHPIVPGNLANSGSVSGRVGVTRGQGPIPAIGRRFDSGGPTGSAVGTWPRSSPAGVAGTRPPLNNVWTDPRGPRRSPADRAGRYGENGAYDAGQSYLQDRAAAGQHLYPGAHDGAARVVSRNSAGVSPQDFDHQHRTHRRHPYVYTGIYYPYFYGGYFPGYYGGASTGYYTGLDDSFTSPLTTGETSENQATNGGGGYWDRPESAEVAPTSEQPAPLPDQPKSIGPENPTAEGPAAQLEQGPDSLVEAVQTELAKRGYFPAKVDSMYGESTRQALQRFQADRNLKVTGRINEATLHALQLD